VCSVISVIICVSCVPFVTASALGLFVSSGNIERTDKLNTAYGDTQRLYKAQQQQQLHTKQHAYNQHRETRIHITHTT